MIKIAHEDELMTVEDAIGLLCSPQLIGRLVEILAAKGILDADDLCCLVPNDYYIKTNEKS